MATTQKEIDEILKLQNELKYLTNLINVHKNEKKTQQDQRSCSAKVISKPNSTKVRPSTSNSTATNARNISNSKTQPPKQGSVDQKKISTASTISIGSQSAVKSSTSIVPPKNTSQSNNAPQNRTVLEPVNMPVKSSPKSRQHISLSPYKKVSSSSLTGTFDHADRDRKMASSKWTKADKMTSTSKDPTTSSMASLPTTSVATMKTTQYQHTSPKRQLHESNRRFVVPPTKFASEKVDSSKQTESKCISDQNQRNGGKRSVIKPKALKASGSSREVRKPHTDTVHDVVTRHKVENYRAEAELNQQKTEKQTSFVSRRKVVRQNSGKALDSKRTLRSDGESKPGHQVSGISQDVVHNSVPSKLVQKSTFKLVRCVQSSLKPLTIPAAPKYKIAQQPGSKFHWQQKMPSNNLPTCISPTSPSVLEKSRYRLVKKAIQISIMKQNRSPNVFTPRTRTSSQVFKRKLDHLGDSSQPPIKRKYQTSHRSATTKQKSLKKAWTKKYSLKRDNSDLAATWTKKYSLKRGGSGSPKNPSINQVLGRKVVNLSKDKFKFINASARRMKKKYKKFSLDRRSLPLKEYTRSRLFNRYPGSTRRLSFLNKSYSSRRFLNRNVHRTLKGNIYRLSNRDLYSTTPGNSYHGYHRVLIMPSLVRSNHTRELASRSIQKSIQAAHRASFRKVNQKQKSYCLYFSRFGRCHRGVRCPNIHDPERVAVCTRFLRGRCEVVGCPFLHKVSKERMPVCQYFLKGACSRDNCPYLHSNVNKDALVCKNFLHGYCSLGDKCPQKHTLICPDFKKSGSCKNGRRCPLKHVKKTTRIPKQNSTQATRTLTQVKTAERADEDDITLPMKDRILPSFIAIDSYGFTPEQEVHTTKDVSTLHIRPRLLSTAAVSQNTDSQN